MIAKLKRKRPDDIGYAVGWLCGALFITAPIAAAVYLYLHRRRPAIQAAMIGVISLLCIIGIRALMIASGIQHKPTEWNGLNALVFAVVPSIATWIVTTLAWPSAGKHRK